MSESNASAGAGATPAETAAPAGESAAAGNGPSVVNKLKTHPRVQHALSVAKAHPLGAVLGVAAAAALIEVEFAVGVLTGLGATALLATKSGPEAREQVLARGKLALARARAEVQKRRKPKVGGEQAAPPPG